MGSESEAYTIDELAQESGVKVRNIRYYIAEGLLEAPQERGKYTCSHLLRLRLIKRLSEQFVRLEQIRKWLHRSDAQIEQWLQEAGDDNDIRELAEDNLAADAVTEKPAEGGKSARDYIARVLGKQPPPASPASPAQAPIQSAPAMRRRESAQREEARAEPQVSSETWQRILLSEGLELNVRTPIPPEIQELVRRIQELARQSR